MGEGNLTLKKNGNIYIISKKFIVIAILFILLGVPAFSMLPSHASSGSIVRVGYSPDDAFFYKDKDGIYQGLYAEYLYNISQYTGWQYEFISGSQENLLGMLSKGSIDMLLNVNYTPEKRAVCYFPDYPITMQQLCIVVPMDNNEYGDSSLSNLRNKKIGTISDTYSETVLLKLIKDKRLDCIYCPYSDYKNLMYAFTAGSVDAIVLNISDVDDSQRILQIIDTNDLYLAVSKLKPGILQNLNKALKQIHLNYPYYSSELYEKYVEIEGKNYTPGPAALQYMKEAPTLKVAYLKENPPFEYYREDDICQGIVGAYFSAIAEKSSLNFQYIPVNSYTNALSMIEAGDADIIASIYSDKIFANTYSLHVTDQYYDLNLSLIRRNDTSLNLHEPLNVSLISNVAGTDNYLAKLYPHMNFKYYNSIAKCIESVREGKTAAAILPSEMTNMFLQQHYYSDLVISNGLQLSVPVSIGVRDALPSELLLILNQTLKSMPESEKEAILLENIVQTTYSVSLKNMLSANMIPLLFIILCLAFFIIAAILLINRIRYNKVLTVSETDQLTGILNKGSVESHIRHYLRNSPREMCALYIIDIDHFKAVNDTFGHKKGDEIIHDTARIIYGTFGRRDIIGRMGGDEFIALQTRCSSLQEIKNKADTLIKNLRRSYPVSAVSEYPLTASVGIIVYKNGNFSYEELIERADKLLYEVKKTGRNNYKLSL